MADKKFSQFTSGGEMQVGDIPVGLRTGQPTLNFQFDFPGTGLKDSSGNYLFRYATAGAAAVNYPLFTNSVAGQPVIIGAGGTDTDIDININPKGAGGIILDGLNWPTSDGTMGQFMYTDGSANLGFTTAAFPVAPGAAGTILRSDGSNWVASTATFADTYGASRLLYSNGANTVTGLATANSAVLVTSATGVPVWSGTLTNGQVIFGSTGATPVAGSFTAGAGITLTPTAGGLTIAAMASVATTYNADSGSATPAANILTINGGTTGLTTTGSGSTISLTGILGLSNGGSNAALVASNGGIVYSNATQMAILSGTGTAGRVLQSGASAAPTWSTATFPSTATGTGTILRADGTNWVATTATFANTYAASTILYSNGANTVTGLATANSAVLVSTSAGVPVWSSTMTNGQVIIGNTSGTPTAATLTAGTGVTITNAASSITINSTGGGVTWTVVTGTSQSAAVNNGYVSNNAGLVTITLPTTAAVGTLQPVAGLGVGGWKIAQNASQLIHLGSSVTTTGIGGSLASTNRYDSITLLCVVADTEWIVLNAPQSSGITVV